MCGRRLAVVIETFAQRRVSTIRYIVPNLRHRWPEELKPYTDNQVAACYENFSLSDDYGNNDNKFPQWFGMLEEYPTAEEVARRRDFLDGG
jgi:hypothetical protein